MHHSVLYNVNTLYLPNGDPEVVGEIEEGVKLVFAEFSDGKHVMSRDARDLEVLSPMRMRRRRVMRRLRSVRQRVGVVVRRKRMVVREERSVERVERQRGRRSIGRQKR